jgi:predicted nucleic acid-binding protein
MKLLLHDANVLIDLITIDILDMTFKLPYVMETTDFVVREIVPQDQREAIQRIIDADRLTVRTATTELVGEIVRLHLDIPALTIADCSIICHAIETGAVVLSGDGLLRKTARARSLKVCGTLWVLQQLVSENLIEPNIAIEKLTELMVKNVRLPKQECSRLIEQWRTLTLR